MFIKKSLRWLQGALLKSHRWSLRNPKLTVGTFFSIAMIGLVCATQLRMLLVIDDLIDQDFNTYSELNQLNRSFADKNNLYVVVSPEAGTPLTAQAICDLQEWVRNLVEERRDLVRVLSTFGVQETSSRTHSLSFVPVMKLDCSEPIAEQKEIIRNGLEKVRASPWGSVLTSKNKDDVMINFNVGDTLVDKNWFSKKPNSFDIQIVGQIMESFESNFAKKHPELSGSWGGVGAYQYFLKQGYDQTSVLNLLTVAVILLLLGYFLGSWKSGLLFLLSYTMAILPVYGAMAIFGAPIDVLSNSLAIMVLIASLEDFVFVSFIRQKERSKSWRYAFRAVLVPGFFTSVATVVGFDALGSADLQIIARFGFWAGLAAGIEFLTVFYFLPALMQVFPRLQQWTQPRERSWAWIEVMGRWRFPKALAFISLIVFSLSLFRLGSLYVSDTPESVFPQSHAVQSMIRKMESSRGWRTEISLVFKDYSERAANQEKLKAILQDPAIRSFENPYEMDDYLTRSMPQHRADLVRSLWEDHPVYRRLVNPDQNMARVVLYIQQTDIVGINELYKKVSNICEGHCYLAGTLVSYGEFGERVLSSLLGSLAWSLVLVSGLILLLAYARGVPQAWALLASAMWGPLALMFLFVVFKIPIFYVTSIFASILIGLAGDNPIQFIFSHRRQGQSSLEGADKLGSASIFLTFSMICLSSVMFLSYFDPLKKLAAMMIVGFILSIIGELWVLKAFLRRKD